MQSCFSLQNMRFTQSSEMDGDSYSKFSLKSRGGWYDFWILLLDRFFGKD